MVPGIGAGDRGGACGCRTKLALLLTVFSNQSYTYDFIDFLQPPPPAVTPPQDASGWNCQGSSNTTSRLDIMKSKRRHELQTNELADQLGHWIERVRPHMATIALAFVAATAILAVWFYWASSKERLVEQAWRAYMFAGSNPQGDFVKELNVVADEYSDTQAGLWAAQTAADVEAGQAVRMLFQETSTAETGLASAIKGYERVLDNKLIKNSPMLERRAHFGLAQALEASGDLTKAIDEYQAVIDSSPDTGMAKVSQQRIDHLSSDSTKKWYNWFANQKPAPSPPAMGTSPLDGLGAPAADLGTLPEGPSDSFMQGADDAGSAGTSAEVKEAESTTPAEPEAEPSATEAPANSGPGIDPPAVDPPAVDPPTSEKQDGGSQ